MNDSRRKGRELSSEMGEAWTRQEGVEGSLSAMTMFLGTRCSGVLSSFVVVFLPSSPILSSVCGHLVSSWRGSAVIFSKFSWWVWGSGVQMS